jgi:hypothetical protein
VKNLINSLIFTLCLAPMGARAQLVPYDSFEIEKYSDSFFTPDTSLLNEDIFEVNFKADSTAVLRTARHLKYFNPYEQLFIEVLCVPENFKGPRNSNDAEVLKRVKNLWAISSITLNKKGTYIIRFYTEPKGGEVQKVVEYTFLHTIKQPINKNYISMIYREIDID